MADAARELGAIASRTVIVEPDVSAFDVSSLAEPALVAARFVWARRVANEAASVEVARRLRRTAARLSFGDLAAHVTSAIARLEEDEIVHAKLAARMTEHLGGASPAAAPLADVEGGDAVVSFFRQTLTALCVCESVSAARYSAVWEHTDLAIPRALIDLFLRDEVIHAKLGFALLPIAIAQLNDGHGASAASELAARELTTVFRELDLSVGLDAERRGMPEAREQPEDNPGVIEPALDALAFYDAIERSIVPKLEELGLPAERAWRSRFAETAPP